MEAYECNEALVAGLSPLVLHFSICPRSTWRSRRYPQVSSRGFKRFTTFYFNRAHMPVRSERSAWRSFLGFCPGPTQDGARHITWLSAKRVVLRIYHMSLLYRLLLHLYTTKFSLYIKPFENIHKCRLYSPFPHEKQAADGWLATGKYNGASVYPSLKSARFKVAFSTWYFRIV